MISDPYKIAKWSMSESIVSWIFRRVVVTSYLFEWYVYLDEKWVETKTVKGEETGLSDKFIIEMTDYLRSSSFTVIFLCVGAFLFMVLKNYLKEKKAVE